MIHKVYSVYDSKSETYSLPFFVKMEAEAHRYFQTWVNDRNHTFGMHPEDYTLFSTGDYDDANGLFTQDHIDSAGNGVQYLIKNEDFPQ